MVVPPAPLRVLAFIESYAQLPRSIASVKTLSTSSSSSADTEEQALPALFCPPLN